VAVTFQGAVGDCLGCAFYIRHRQNMEHCRSRRRSPHVHRSDANNFGNGDFDEHDRHERVRLAGCCTPKEPSEAFVQPFSHDPNLDRAVASTAGVGRAERSPSPRHRRDAARGATRSSQAVLEALNPSAADSAALLDDNAQGFSRCARTTPCIPSTSVAFPTAALISPSTADALPSFAERRCGISSGGAV
jgi:hypothetical protein